MFILCFSMNTSNICLSVSVHVTHKHSISDKQQITKFSNQVKSIGEKKEQTKSDAHDARSVSNNLNMCTQQQRLSRIDDMCDKYNGHAAKPFLIDNLTDEQVKKLGKTS